MINKEQLVQIVAQACEEEKAIDVVILEVGDITILADYFVLASGRSNLQVRSIVDNVIDTLKEYDFLPLRKEGHQEGSWVVLDYGSTILHVFREEEREYYNLESLWGDAKAINIE